MIETLTKTAQLKEIILDEIRKGVYKSGGGFPSIRDICKQYGVCKQTASHALVSLREMGVLNVSHGKSTTVALGAGRMNVELIQSARISMERSEFWRDVISGAREELEKRPECVCNVRLAFSRNLDEVFSDPIALFRTGGILLVGSNAPSHIQFLRRQGIPFLTVYQRALDGSAPFVSVDFDGALRDIVESFIRAGRSRLAYIGPASPERGIDFEKLRLFKKHAAARGLLLDESLTRDSGYEPAQAYAEMRSLLQGDKRPDAVFLASDALCMAAYRAVFEEGLSIPRDIAVAGCDNLADSAYMSPPLTSIDVRRMEIGRLAARKLLEAIESGRAPASATLKARLTARKSI